MLRSRTRSVRYAPYHGPPGVLQPAKSAPPQNAMTPATRAIRFMSCSSRQKTQVAQGETVAPRAAPTMMRNQSRLCYDERRQLHIDSDADYACPPCQPLGIDASSRCVY